mgnify:CR=1 FL=1
MLCEIVYSFEWAKNQWALPTGVLDTLLALFALSRQMPTYFFRSVERVDDFTYHIKKMKEIGSIPRHLKVRLDTPPGEVLTLLKTASE